MVILITIFMIIVNVQDHADAIQQKAADFQQITKGDVLIHHTDHLPSVQVSSGSKNQKKTWPPTVIGMPSEAQYTHFAKNVKWKHLQFFNKKPLDKRGVMAYNRDGERAYQ